MLTRQVPPRVGTRGNLPIMPDIVPVGIWSARRLFALSSLSWSRVSQALFDLVRVPDR
jgi:hypothetical protein